MLDSPQLLEQALRGFIALLRLQPHAHHPVQHCKRPVNPS
jgi:hypothetical protein